MAALETVDILKRDNATVLLNILKNRETLKRGKNSSGEETVMRNVLRLIDHVFFVTEHNIECLRALLIRHCERVKGSPPEVMTEDGSWHRITSFFKDHRFVPKNTIKGAPADKDKVFQQRQEKGLVAAINASQGITIPLSESKIVRAEQAPDIGPHGKENLVDVVIYNTLNHTFNVSCKQTNAADLGGGGISGILKTAPSLVKTLYETTIKDLQNLGFIHGESYSVNLIPQFQYKIPPQFTYKLFRGSPEVGGEIDYMYIGPADVVLVNGTLNGMFIPIAEYAKKKTYYFRLRKRDVFDNVVTVNYERLNSNHLPVIFTSGPMQAPAARFVVEDRVLSTSILKELHYGDCEHQAEGHSAP